MATATRHASHEPDSGSGGKGGEDVNIAGLSAIDQLGNLDLEETMSRSNSQDCTSSAPGLSVTSRIRRSARIRGHRSSLAKVEGRVNRARKRRDPPEEGRRDKYVLVKILKTDDSGNILHCRKATADEIESLTWFLLLSRPRRRRFDDSTSGGFDPSGSGGQTQINHPHLECTGVSHPGSFFANGRGALGGSDESASQYSARWSST